MRESIQDNGFSEVNPDHALIDKFEIKSTMGLLLSLGGEHLRAFKSAVSRLPTQGETARDEEYRAANNSLEEDVIPHSPNGVEGNLNKVCGWIFNSVSSERFYAQHTVASKAIEGRYPKPLFSGSMSIHGSGIRGTEDESPSDAEIESGALYRQSSCRISYDLKFNLNRFLHHNNPERRSPSAYKVGAHFADLGCDSEDGEYSLDYQDNWVQAFKFARLRGWAKQIDYLDLYLQGVEDAIWMDLLRATLSTSIEEARQYFRPILEQEEKYKLDSCEIAWEFESPNPIRQVEELAPYMRLYVREGVEINDYRVSEGDHGYSNSVIIRLGNGNQIALYAKTNRRIRFEYRYRSDRGVNVKPLSVKTAEHKIGLYLLIDELRGHAVVEMNKLFSFLRERARGNVISSDSESLVRLYMGVLKHSKGDLEVAETILEQLELNGVVQKVPKVRRSLHRAIRAMATNQPQILVYDSDAGCYLPRPRYRWAVSQLERVGGWEMLSQDPLEAMSCS